MGCEPSSLRLALIFPLFGAPKCNASNNKEGWCALALGGHHFNDTHNNQMQDGFNVTVDVREDALPGQSVWKDVVSLLGAANSNTTTKSQKLKYIVALDGRQSIFFTQQPTKNTQAHRRRRRRRGLTRGGMHGGMKPSFWGALEFKRR